MDASSTLSKKNKNRKGYIDLTYKFFTATYILCDKMNQAAKTFEKLYKEPHNEERVRYASRLDSIGYDCVRYVQEIRFYTNSPIVLKEPETLMMNTYQKVMRFARKLADPETPPLTKDQKEVMQLFAERINTMTEQYRKAASTYLERHSIETSVYRFLAKGFEPTYDRMLLKKGVVPDAGKSVIQAVIHSAAKKKCPNVLFSNLEYWLSTMTELKDDLKDSVKFYATYRASTSLINTNIRKRLNRVAIGDFDSYRIQRKVFDIIVHRFTHDMVYHDENRTTEIVKRSRIEQEINRMKGYLVDNGVLLLTIPTFLLRSKELLAIASNFEYLWNIELPTDMPVHYTLVALRYHYAQNQKKKDATFQTLKNMHPVKEMTAELAESTISLLPKATKEVRLMEGAYPDTDFLQIVLDESPIRSLPKQREEEPIRPLLPLKKGQIGQILASGRLDGVIEEPDGQKHVIRGRVYKGIRNHTKTNYDNEDDASEETISIINNMIEINLVAGDGTYKHVMLQK